MISFTDITESIQHMRNGNKQIATTETIFNFINKRDHYKELSTLDLEEEINTLASTIILCKNDKNSLFIGTSAKPSKKDHELSELLGQFTDAESSGNKSQRTADLEISIPIEKYQSDNSKENLSV